MESKRPLLTKSTNAGLVSLPMILGILLAIASIIAAVGIILKRQTDLGHAASERDMLEKKETVRKKRIGASNNISAKKSTKLSKIIRPPSTMEEPPKKSENGKDSHGKSAMSKDAFKESADSAFEAISF